MTKAMEALERLRPDKDCACVVCEELEEDFVILRDYITTTEAALRVAREGLEKLSMLGGGRSEGNYIAKDTIRDINAQVEKAIT